MDSVKPVLTAKVSGPSGGQVTAKFFAGTYAAGGAWDLVNGGTVTVASGSVARLTLPVSMPIGTEFDWQVQACQSGTCSALTTLQDTHVSPMLGAGARPGATRLSFSAGDHVSAQVDVGSGNVLVSTSDLTLPGINGDVGLGASYNSESLGSGFTSTSAPAGYGWLLTPYDVSLTVHEEGSVTYRGRAGVTGLFVSTGTGFTAPGGFKADLVKNSDGTYTLTDHSSQTKQTFDSSGKLTKITDRNGNATTLGYSGALPGSIVATRGTTTQRTGVYANASGHVTTLKQTASDGSVRTVAYTVNSSGDLASVKDTLNRTTSFGYTAHKLTSITNPGGGITNFTYGARGVTSVTQHNTATGSPGDSVTRLSYPSATQTLLAAPDTNQTQSVSTVPHTTYDLSADNTAHVTKATDADGNVRSKTYTANFDTSTSTIGAGTGASTTSNEYNANSGESLTKTTSPTGATQSALYGNTAAATKYLPSSSTDAQSNSSTYHYSGTGQRDQATDANAAVAKVTYNSDGTVATSTDPGNSDSATYGYDSATHQATSVTPVAGGSLGGQTFSYDKYGRLATAKDGRNITTTYGYDDADRITSVTYSDSTHAVGYTYDSFGRVRTRTDATGTTTYTYDDLGHLATRTATSGGGTLTYGYDKSGNLTTVADARGTATYSYDDANLLTQLVTAAPTSTKIRFAYDDHGRRTDTWFGTDTNHTIYKAHVHQDFDASGRPSRVWADQGPATSPSRQFDVTYCRATGGTPGATCSAAAADDRSLLQWSKDNLTGKTTTYGYDPGNRLTSVATSGGGTTYSYGYDIRGNRTTATGATTLTHNAANQITTSGYTYDAAGNLTKTPSLSSVAYNGADQMTAATTSTGTGTYTYVGGTYDRTTGWIKYGQRWYNPTTGRFTTQDAHSFLADPAQGNHYAYAADDPINNTDPTGQFGLSSVTSGLAKGLDAYDWLQAGTSLLSGDISGAASGFASISAGVVAGSVCEAATAPESAGLSTVGCYAFGVAASYSVQVALS
ncbi:RHS repeat domain-containing protein [Streptomyces sp. NPDC093221]|uniref:RHS repeat domain-containing protein n=1 Tax=Streptomyces sp. NPDC093221 TaxID=3366032 RepID=UPI00380A6E3C